MYNDNQERTAVEGAVAGRNSVIEVLRSEREIECIYIQNGEHTGSINRIIAMAKERGVPIKECDPRKLESLCPGENHQGVVALCAAKEYCTVEDILALAGDQPPFIIIADHIEDPHNLGAIIRSAEGAGAHGLVIPKRGSAGLTASVAKASAGAVEHLAVARVANIAALVGELKKKGIWTYCAEAGGTNWCEVDYSGGVALVIGSEGQGVSRVVREACDVMVSLPMEGKVNSLNASVAAGIVMYEILRQRRGIKAILK